MSLIHHILVVVAYTLVAAVVAVGLPQVMPRIGQVPAVVFGVVFLAGSALLHEVFLRQEGESRMAERLREMQVDFDEIRRRLNRVLDRVDGLQREVKVVKAQAVKGRERGHEVETVIAEVKVLQGLIEQLSSEREAFASGGESAAAEDAPPPRTAEAGSGAMAEPFLPADGGGVPEVARDLDDEGILKVVREGLNNNRVDLYLQPIVSLPQRRRKYFETFTRIRDDRGRMVVPDQYIAIAEREGLITAIDNMLLFRCVQLVRRSQHQNSNVGFFCNISAHSLSDRHFFRNFVEFVADNTELAPNLIFEFAQSTVIDGDRDMDRLLDYLALRGFRFSIDQVGSLNLDYGDLARRHFKFVKIDAATVMKDLRSESSRIAPEDVKRMIERHGIDLIVEKIESEPMLLDLLDLRIDFGQGYLFGEPRITRLG